MLAWTLVSLLFTIALVIIGLKRWEGWLVAAIANVGWIFYSVVGGVRVLELIVAIIGLAVSVIFWLRWNKAQRLQDEEAEDRAATPVLGDVV